MSRPDPYDLACDDLRPAGWGEDVLSEEEYLDHMHDLREKAFNSKETRMHLAIPANAVCFFRDGNKWCCVFGDFINLQESPAGFGDTFDEALDGLKKDAVSGVESVPNFHVDNRSTTGVV